MALIPWQGGWDVHGDMQDVPACEVFFEFATMWKPKIRVCGGDLWDFRPLRKGACEDERRQSLSEDFTAGQRWFNRFKPTIYLRGNHCERLWELAESDSGVASDFAQEGVGKVEAMVKHHKCIMLPYHKRNGIYKLGDTNLLHGFYGGISAARQTALTYRKSVFGHFHGNDIAAVPGLEEAYAVGAAALCRLDMDYNARHPNTLRQANGWVYGLLNDKTGRLITWQAKQIDGKWIIPTGYVEL